jgi:hypothetical protein
MCWLRKAETDEAGAALLGNAAEEQAGHKAAAGCNQVDRENWDHGFCVIRDDENPAIGLVAKNPSATYTVEGHIIHGSRPGWASQYISTTTELSVAQRWAPKDSRRVVAIDWRKSTAG